ncbi:AIR synthase-related protein [Eubacterium oxidoreducens]|uniref:AIR synthase related protein, C-terminal domain n=1 Tax=Eubacterium oxidoreducens TaxID=1732 RepID=A0A1G6CIN3_EUBOX|nr:AIR synthase-related protein [Eubacterium oxidoreducens]SDB32749.1 AIR synthase related protein, C-terminal domain [Eubacterium oxidoreducens]
MDDREKNRALRAKTLKKFLEITDKTHANQTLWEIVTAQKKNKRIEPLSAGDELVLVGNIGYAATVYLAKYKKEELETRIHPRVVSRGLKMEAKPLPKHLEIAAIYEVTEGGLNKSLNELAKDYQKGFWIDARRVMIRQETVEFCEFYDLHPWDLLSKDCYLLVTKRAMKVVDACKKAGLICNKIGHLTPDNKKVICRAGEESLLNRARPDALLTVLKKDFE